MCIKIYTQNLGSTRLKAIPQCWESEYFRFQILQFASFLNTGCHGSRRAVGAASLFLDAAVGRAPEAVSRHALRCPSNKGTGIWAMGWACNQGGSH